MSDEEAIIDQIKKAYDRNCQDEVFALVGKLLYEGPGTIDRTGTNP
jgi:hypothetical protein